MYLLLFARFLLVLGGLNYFFVAALNINLFSFIQNEFIVRIISLLIGLSALYFLFNRDYYLPFLGPAVIPVGTKKPTENLTKIALTGLPPKTTIMAWGSQNGKDTFDNPFDAYGSYANTELTKSDENGNAIVQLSCPSEYYVNKFGIMKQKLDRHIHYRYELPKYKGIYSPIYTRYLDENCT
jgi:uncharacterized membrane protein YuzA (DUF378 family)